MHKEFARQDERGCGDISVSTIFQPFSVHVNVLKRGPLYYFQVVTAVIVEHIKWEQGDTSNHHLLLINTHAHAHTHTRTQKGEFIVVKEENEDIPTCQSGVL